jgi:hypothetical protein
MILTEQDKPTYFPFVPLTGAALVGALTAAQMTAETEAGRPLEIQQYKEILAVPPNLGQVQLKYCPVLLDRPIEVFGCTDFSSDGHSVTDYTLDEDGLLTLKHHHAVLRVTYQSGYDFSSDTPIVQKIKAATAAILNYQVLG